MKRFLCSLLILLMIITMVPISGFSVVGGSLYITSPKTINGESGESLKIPITIKNTSVDEVSNISVTAKISNPNFVYLSGSAFKNINYIEAGDSQKFNFNVEIDDLAPKGSYQIEIEINYEDYLGAASTSDTIFVRVDSNPPQLNISRVDVLPNNTVTPGQVFNVGIEFQNIGEVLAKDIKVSLEGLSESGFSLANGSKTQTIQSIPGGFKNYAVYQLKASKSMLTGSYRLELKLKYNESMEETLEFSVNVEKNKDNVSYLKMENLTYPTGSIGQNKEVLVSFDLRNQGQIDAKNIIIKADSMDMSGLVPKSVSLIKIDSILPGATESVTFKFITTQNGETKNYPIQINVDYEDELVAVGEKYNINQYIGIFAVAPGEKTGNLSTPKLIIDKYNFDPSLVKAGENFTMNLSFFNTNSSKTVKNIKIFLTSDERTDANSNSAGGSVFTPVDSSNTFYIDSIPPKGRVEKSITMFTVPDAAAKTYTLTANFEYEDSAANPFEATELIGVPVIQTSKLETGEIGYSPEAYIGQSTPISLEFFNTGKVTLYNMMVKIEGDFQTENGQLYIGNFTSGSSEYFEGYVIPNAPGELKGDLVFSYEDSTGQEQEIRKDFTLNVMDMPMEPEFPGGMPPMEEVPSQGGIKGIFKSMLFWVILAIIAVITGIVILKKKKKKKLEAMEIDD